MSKSSSKSDQKVVPLKVTELLLRDAHQSLLATRMRLEDMLPICAELDNVGYYSLEVWGGATFDSCLRFLDEDPWERLRKLKAALPKTPLQMLLRGQNILGYRHYADDVVDRFVKKSIEYGMDIFRIFDALNDTRNMRAAIESVKAGGGHAQGAMCYTTSPVHTEETFVQMGRELEAMGCDSLVIKDMAALLCPVPCYNIVKALKESVKISVHVHTHSTTGVAPMVLVRAADAGADGVDTAISSLSGGPGHVATECLVESLRGTNRDTGLDQLKLKPIADYARNIRPKYKEFESGFTAADPRIFLSQIPGGMLSNLESQLKQNNCLERIDEVMEEVPKVREDMGFIPLVTPTSQIVGTQAVLNVLMGERYKVVPTETRDIFAGRYGRTPSPVNAEIQKKVLKDLKPIECRPADEIPNEFEKIRAEIKDISDSEDDALSYALFPKVFREFADRRAKGFPPREEEKPKPKSEAEVKPAGPVAAPVAAPSIGDRYHFRLNLGRQEFEASVEVLEN